MKGKLEIKDIQNINLFEKITGVKARSCFYYNYVTVFAVPSNTIKRISREKFMNLCGKIGKVRIIAMPKENDNTKINNFVTNLIYPLTHRKTEVINGELNIYTNPKVKAMLIGKDKLRLKELTNAIKIFFNIEKVSIR